MHRRSFLAASASALALVPLALAGARAHSVRPVQSANGGDGGRQIIISSLALSGTRANLQYALETMKGPRTVSFDPSLRGVVELPFQLTVPPDGGDLTLVGSPHVVFRGAPLRFDGTKNVKVSGLLFMPGDGAVGRPFEDRDCIQLLSDASDILIESSMFLWGTDENVSLYPTTGKDGVRRAPHNVEIKNCVIAEPLRHAGHPKGEHGYALLIGSGVKDVCIHGNLIADFQRRGPAIQDCANIQFVNNVVFGWGQVATRFTQPENKARNAVIAGNWYSSGGLAGQVPEAIGLEHIKHPGLELEIAGNLYADGSSADAVYWQDNPPEARPVISALKSVLACELVSAIDARRSVAASAGVLGDPHRGRLMAQLELGKAAIIDSQEEVGGYSAYL
jgi:hypothetical protein